METKTATDAQQSGGLRFEGALGGSEYDLLKLAMPHYNDLQAEIGRLVKNRCETTALVEISVLEIGPGSGITTRVLLDADPRIRITAVDNSVKMQADYKAWIEEQGHGSRVDFKFEEILAYLRTVPDETFDIVATGFVIHNIEFETRDRLIREIYRVLRGRGGYFVNGDKIVPDDGQEYAKAYAAQVKAFDIFDTPGVNRPKVKKEWVKHYKEDAEPKVIYPEAVAMNGMRRAGFGGVRSTYRHLLEAVVCGCKG